jgi:hypothetical protein
VSDSNPGVPKEQYDGKYLVFTYEAVLADDKKVAVETLVTVLDSHDEWRVAGYSMR